MEKPTTCSVQPSAFSTVDISMSITTHAPVKYGQLSNGKPIGKYYGYLGYQVYNKSCYFCISFLLICFNCNKRVFLVMYIVANLQKLGKMISQIQQKQKLPVHTQNESQQVLEVTTETAHKPMLLFNQFSIFSPLCSYSSGLASPHCSTILWYLQLPPKEKINVWNVRFNQAGGLLKKNLIRF